MLNLFSITSLALSLVALATGPTSVDAVVVQLFVDRFCPAENPGPVCTDVGDIAYYYTSALVQGLENPEYYVAPSYNQESKCEAASITVGDGCKDTPGGFRNAYGFFWYKSWCPYPPPDALSAAGIAPVNSSVTAECTESVAPDVYFIKFAANASAIPIAREVLLDLKRSVDVGPRKASIGGMEGLIDGDTGAVRGEMIKKTQEILAKHGSGLTDAQIAALRVLRSAA